MSEKSFENRIKNFLKEEGCWFLKYWGGGEFTKAGIPDILCCCCGRFLGIEVKSAKGRASKIQLYHLRKIDEAGGYGILLYPNNYTVFREFIHCIQNGDDEVLNKYKFLKRRWEDEI